MDPTVGTDNVKETPIQLAAEKDAVETMTLFAEYAQNPASMKAKLLKLIIESDGKQDASLDAFKQQLESLSASEVTSCSYRVSQKNICGKQIPHEINIRHVVSG